MMTADKVLKNLGYEKRIDNNRMIVYATPKYAFHRTKLVINKDGGVYKLQERLTSRGVPEKSWRVNLSFCEVLACSEIIKSLPEVDTLIDELYPFMAPVNMRRENGNE